MKTNVAEKIKGLFANAEFVAKVEKAENPDEIRALFLENGVELTDEEFVEYIAAGNQVEEELNLEDLDDVAGGGAVGLSLKALKYTWKASVKVWGSEKKAVKGIVNYWGDVFSGKDPTKRM